MDTLNMFYGLEPSYAFPDPADPYADSYLDSSASPSSGSPTLRTADILDALTIPDVSVSADIYPSPVCSSRASASACSPRDDHENDSSHDADADVEAEAEAEAAGRAEPPKKPAPKRKRENRYKNAPPSVLSRRRAQNRASQRAYRERKDQRIRDLEQMLAEAKQKNDALSQAFCQLQNQHDQLRTTAARSSHSHSRAHHSAAAAAAAAVAQAQAHHPHYQHQHQHQQPRHSISIPFSGVDMQQSGTAAAGMAILPEGIFFPGMTSYAI